LPLELLSSSSLELLSDEQLVSRAKAGAREAFNQLVIRHERRLYRFLCKGAANVSDIEDAMQQAMVKAYLKLSQYNPRWRFTTWLFTIALRELRSLARRPGPATMALEVSHEPAAPAVVAAVDTEGPGELWMMARRLLKPQHFTALWLRYGEDLPVRDIAKILGRPRIWVSVTLHRACTLLRQTAGREGDRSDSVRRAGKSRSKREQTAGELS
jgi:RNA polymerase sigma-70 factor (ECF subfamily)